MSIEEKSFEAKSPGTAKSRRSDRSKRSRSASRARNSSDPNLLNISPYKASEDNQILMKLMNKLENQEKSQNEKFNKVFDMVLDLKKEIIGIRQEHKQINNRFKKLEENKN